MKPSPGYLTIMGDDTPREPRSGWLLAITIGIVLPLICVAAVGIQKRALQEQTLHDLGSEDTVTGQDFIRPPAPREPKGTGVTGKSDPRLHASAVPSQKRC